MNSFEAISIKYNPVELDFYKYLQVRNYLQNAEKREEVSKYHYVCIMYDTIL